MQCYVYNGTIYMWLTVHGVFNGSIIQPGVAWPKIFNVSSSFSNSNVVSSVSCSASLRKFVKYCINNNHKDFYWIINHFANFLTRFMVSISFDTAKIHSCCSSIFTFFVNVDALYMHLISREHTFNVAAVLMVIGNNSLSYTFALHVWN